MPRRPARRLRPSVEGLESVIALSSIGAPPVLVKTPPGTYPKANRDRAFTVADLQAYAKAYLARVGDADFNPAYDFNGTGFIGQPDAVPILDGLAAVTPEVPFRVVMNLAPGEQIQGRHPQNSGGVTYKRGVTVIGRTTPNSIVFYDQVTGNGAGDYKFLGGAVVANARGVFQVSYKLPQGLVGTDYLIRTPFGQQMTHDFPVEVVPG